MQRDANGVCRASGTWAHCMALDGYASPHLRKAVFDKLHPNSQVEYEIIPLDEAFPHGHHEVADESQAEEAIVCTIITETGQFFQGAKEIELFTKRKGPNNVWDPRPQTPVAYTVDCTKALGRALYEIERELIDMAFRLDGYWRTETEAEKLRALARRIAVQIETEKLSAAA